MNKVIIIPLIYRDINTQENQMVKVDELNGIYQRIISVNQFIIDNKDSPIIDLGVLDARLQSTLVEMFDYFVDRIFGKDGIQRRSAMGRRTEYASRAVISAPEFNDYFGSSVLKLNRAGYPLSIISSNYILEMTYNIDKLLREYVSKGYFGEECTIQDYEEYFDNERIGKLITVYDESWGERLRHVYIEKDDGTIFTLKIPINVNGEEMLREISVTELLYIVAYPIFELKDRFMLISRYPIMDDKNEAITLIHILTTIHTMKVVIDGLEYPYYPNFLEIDELDKESDVYLYEEKLGALFRETVVMSNTFLKGFDADYDKMQIVA